MSVIKTGLLLSAGGKQYDSTATCSNQHRREVLIPLNEDGSAVVVAKGSNIETPVTIRSAAVLTNAYVLATAVDMSQSNYVRFRATVDTAEAITISIKIAYSMVGGTTASNWDYLQYDTYGTPAGTDVAITSYDALYSLSLASTSNVWSSVFFKRARYCTVAVKYTGATTGKVAVTAQRFNA